jgi:hypothetical protein
MPKAYVAKPSKSKSELRKFEYCKVSFLDAATVPSLVAGTAFYVSA